MRARNCCPLRSPQPPPALRPKPRRLDPRPRPARPRSQRPCPRLRRHWPGRTRRADRADGPTSSSGEPLPAARAPTAGAAQKHVETNANAVAVKAMLARASRRSGAQGWGAAYLAAREMSWASGWASDDNRSAQTAPPALGYLVTAWHELSTEAASMGAAHRGRHRSSAGAPAPIKLNPRRAFALRAALPRPGGREPTARFCQGGCALAPGHPRPCEVGRSQHFFRRVRLRVARARSGDGNLAARAASNISPQNAG